MATASRAMDPASRHVSTTVRSRVVETAKRLGYRPNASARATTMGTTTIVAVVVSDIRDPYNAEIVHGVIEAANVAGLVATIAGTDHLVDDETRVVRMLRSMRPRAIVLTGSRSGSTISRTSLQEELKRYTRDGGRVVVAGDDELPFDTAVVPRRRGARELASALVELGYRSPALIAPDVDSVSAREWENGIIDGTRAKSVRIDYDAAVRAPMSRDGGYEATKRLLADRAPGVDVVMAATDMMALGAMSAIRDAGLRPGEDVGVAGFDNVVDAEDLTPGLTSVDLALAAIGARAVELAVRAPDAERTLVEFAPRVVVRGSTPPRR
jgi:LacI family transcriptional regulator